MKLSIFVGLFILIDYKIQHVHSFTIKPMQLMKQSKTTHLSVTASSTTSSPKKSNLSITSTVIGRRLKQIFKESLSGVVVSLSTIPPSVAYATVIGLNPLAGIWSSFIVGLCIAAFAGGPGLIAGAAGNRLYYTTPHIYIHSTYITLTLPL